MDRISGYIRTFVRSVLLKTRLSSLLTCFTILFSGLVLSILGFEYAFQRSGAVLVSFAIVCVYFNHIVGLHLQLSEAINKGRKTVNPNVFREILRRNLTENEETLEGFLNESSDEQRTMPKKLMNEKTHLELVEFAAAFIGTLVWGFGDIPFV